MPTVGALAHAAAKMQKRGMESKDEREARLKAALRANLLKRKARDRDVSEPAGPEKPA